MDALKRECERLWFRGVLGSLVPSSVLSLIHSSVGSVEPAPQPRRGP
jgi:hypothetical protein